MKTYFDLLGIGEKLHLDTKDLQKKFYALSKELHPDFHQGGTAAEQQASLDFSSRLNHAFLTLKDREKRLQYVTALHLGDITDAEKKKTPPELLMELMELREKLEEYKAEPSDTLRSDLTAALADLSERQKELDKEIDKFSEVFDNAVAPEARRAALVSIRAVMLKKNFVRSLYETIDTELNPSDL
jgi:molecular chaperone HscB